MDYVPKAEHLRQSHSTFMIAESDVRGVYANMDVDSVIFTYKSDAVDRDAFWDALDKKAHADDWKLNEEQPGSRRYERIIPRTGQRAFHSAEETRIAYNPTTKVVTVAWVQADESTLPDGFADTGEGNWAAGVIWPKFQELVAQ